LASSRRAGLPGASRRARSACKAPGSPDRTAAATYRRGPVGDPDAPRGEGLSDNNPAPPPEPAEASGGTN